MKRLSLIIMMLATLSGVFAPVGASLISGGGVTYGVNTAYAQGKVVTPEEAAKKAGDNITENIDCGVGVFNNGSLAGCLATVVYYLVYSLGGIVLEQSAKLLDVSATYTLSSKLFSASSFINDGWRITRDFANIAFIFILLVIALSLILGMELGGNPKRMLASVILIALLINFSMFITKVVIDASNTVALLFYNQISVTDINGNLAVSESTKEITANTGVTQRPIAAALAQAFRPQTFQDKSFFENLKNEETKEVDPSTMIFILLGVGIMFWVAAYSFFIAALSFMGRIVMLMVSIIFAPIAFITYIIPSLKANKELGWSGWWSNLFSVAFSAPIYFFFILLISIMAQSTMIKEMHAVKGNSMMVLTTLFISFMILIVMLNRATAFAKKASGEIGTRIANFGGGLVSAAGGFALGTVTGGTAVLAQKTLGRVSQRIANSNTLQGAAANGGGGTLNRLKSFTAQQALKGAQATSGASFNLGATGVGQKLAGGLGVKMTSFGNLSQKNLAGGYEAAEKRKWEKKEAFSKTLKGDVKEQARIEEELHDNAENIKTATDKFDEAVEHEAKEAQNLAAAKNAEAAATVNFTKAQQDATTAAAAYQQAQAKDAARTILGPNGQAPGPSQETINAKAALDTANTTLVDERKKADDAKIAKDRAQVNADTAKTNKISYEADLNKLRRNEKKLQSKSEVVKNARAKAYMYNELNKTGYAVVGTRRDSQGRITDPGQIDIRQNARGWKSAALQNPGGLGARALAGAAIGSAVPGLGTLVGAGVGLASGLGSGVLNNLRANFNVAASNTTRNTLTGLDNRVEAGAAAVRRTSSAVIGGIKSTVRNAASSAQSAYRRAATNATP